MVAAQRRRQVAEGATQHVLGEIADEIDVFGAA